MPRTTHLSAYFGTIQAPQTLGAVPAVADQAYNIQAGNVFLPEQRTLLGAFAGGVALTIAQLNSASLILNGRPNIVPVDGDAPGGNLAALMWAGNAGLTLPALEQIGMLMTIGGVVNNDMAGFLWHTGGMTPMPPGPVKPVHCTGNATGAKGIWNLGQLTFDTALSRGRWAVVGLATYGANCLASRLVFPNQVDRPGCLDSTAFTTYNLPYFRFGGQGILGIFDNYNPPQIEVLGTGNVAAQDVFLDIMQVG